MTILHDLLDASPSIDVPLRIGDDGAIRVGETRITLATVVMEFQQGAAPEDIVRAYPVLRLDHVYAVITYYLQNKTEVDAFIDASRAQFDTLRQQHWDGSTLEQKLATIKQNRREQK